MRCWGPNMPSVSIVIPAYIANDEQFDWLAEAANSVHAQTFTDWELVLVDDGSPIALEGTT